jgi:hypothetical protein
MNRYDLISPREGRDGKTRWFKVGAAFPRDAGGFSLVFDALPLPDKDGNVRLLMSEAKPRDDRDSYGGAPAGGAPRGGARDMDDEIPF